MVFINNGAVRIDDRSTEHYIYAWNSGGTIYWWSDTDKVYLAGGSSAMFCFLKECTKIDLTGIDTSHATSMRRMFNSCSKLTTLTLGTGFDTSSVRSMYQMFRNCSSLTTVDISGFDPSNVLTMEEMFNGCSKLTKVTFGGNFHAEKVRKMRNMFYDCQVLTTADMSGFYARDLADLYQMFYRCYKLSAIDLRQFNTAEVIDLNRTFYQCRAATTIRFGSGFDTSKAVDMYQTFYNCYGLSGVLDLSGFHAPHVVNMNAMLYGCTMTEVLFSDFDGSSCTDMANMFYGCSKLVGLDVSSFRPVNCTTMYQMFYNCSALKTFTLGSGFDTARCTNMAGMFYKLGSAANDLTALDLGSLFDTSRVIDMSSMFSECTKLVTLTLGSRFNTSSCTNMANMFYNCPKLASIDFSGFHTENVTSMYYMFYNCRAIKTADLSGFDTAKVTTMWGMFRNCSALREITLDPNRFHTDRVTTMYEMFFDCKALTAVDVSFFDLGRVTNINGMFSNCGKLTSLDVSQWNTAKVTNMMYLFSGCSLLSELDMSRWNTAKVTNMMYLFNGCVQLTELDLRSFDTSSCTNMGYLFNGCTRLQTILFSDQFDTGEVVFMSGMFYNCQALTSLDLHTFDTHEVVLMDNMFYACKALTTLDISSFDTHEVTTMLNMFNSCTALTSLLFGEQFNTSEVYTMDNMFSSCNALTSLDLSGFDTAEVVYMNSMFSNCWALNSIALSDRFQTSEVVYMGSMFNECRVLTELDLSHFDTATVTTMNNMFYNCKALTDLDVSSFVTPKVYTMEKMFHLCSALTSLDVSHFDTRRVNSMSNMFAYCGKLQQLDLSSFVTPKLTTMASMFRDCVELEKLLVPHFDGERIGSMNQTFYNCQKLKNLDLSSFHTPRLNDIGSMFRYCYELETLDVSNLDTSNVRNMSYLFESCKKLVSLNLESFNTYMVTNMSYMFNNCETLTDVNLTNFFTSNVTDMPYMFSNCKSIGTLDLSSFDTAKVKNMSYMFFTCSELATIYVSHYWNTDAVTNSGWMFRYDYKLVGGNGTPYTKVTPNNYYNQTIYNDKTYALIDTAAAEDTERVEGYLTYKIPAVNNSTDFSSEDENCLVEPLTDSVCLYTFTGLNPNVQYYAWEEELADEDYIESHLYDSPLMVTALHGTITNRLVTYDDTEPEYGSLSIKKMLRAENGAELTEADLDRLFVFTITLTDEDNQPLQGEALYGGELFVDGVATIRIPGGVTVMLDYIPSGYHYDVTEEEVVRFTASGHNTSGIIETDLVSRAVYTNTKSAEEEKLNSFTLQKMVTGLYEIDADYLFTIALVGLHPEESYHLSDGSVFVTDLRGAATIDVVLKNGESVTVQDVPVGSSYKITEAGGDYVASYFISDAQESGHILQPTGSNLKSDLSLSTTTEYVEEDETITVTFVNTKNVRQNVRLKKVLENASAGNFDVFTFAAELGGLTPHEVVATSLGLRTADEHGQLHIAFELAADDEVIFYDLPVGCTYQFVEDGSEWLASYRLTNSGTDGTIVSVSGSNDVIDTALGTAVETVNENEEVSVVFTNTKVQRDITVTKLVDARGSELSYAEYSGQRFKYLLRFSELEGGKTYTMQYTRQNRAGIEDVGSFTALADGTAEVTVWLTHGLSVKIKNLPKGATYTVTEYPTINYIAGYEISGNEGAVIVKESDRNRKTCRILSTATETVDESELDMNIVFTNRYYNDPTARVCLVTLEKQIDTKVAAFGTPTFLFRLRNLDEGQDFTCSITLDGDRLTGTETVSVTRGHYLVEEITVGRYAADGAEYLGGTTAKQLQINGEDVVSEEYKPEGRMFQFYLDMTEGEPDTAYLKFYDKLANYSGVSHNSFVQNRIA